MRRIRDALDDIDEIAAGLGSLEDRIELALHRVRRFKKDGLEFYKGTPEQIDFTRWDVNDLRDALRECRRNAIGTSSEDFFAQLVAKVDSEWQ